MNIKCGFHSRVVIHAFRQGVSTHGYLLYFIIVARAACGFHSFGGLSATVERQVCFPLTGGYSRSLPRGFYSRVVVSCDFLYGSARSLRLPLTGGLGATVEHQVWFPLTGGYSRFAPGTSSHGYLFLVLLYGGAPLAILMAVQLSPIA